MKVCADCQRAESTPTWPLYTDAWCCRARMVVEMVGRSGAGLTRDDVRRSAAKMLRETYPEDWVRTRERMEWLMGRGGADRRH